VKRTAIAMTLAALLSSGAARAAWTEIDAGASCTLTAVDFADPANGFAVGSYGCGRSTADGGRNWIDKPTGIDETLLAVRMVDERTIYAGRLGLYRSADGGDSWGQAGDLVDYFGSVFDIVIDNSGRLVVIKGEDILTSTDGGDSYRVALHRGSTGYVNELRFPTHDVGYAMGGISYDGASAGNVLKSVDGGRSWINVTPKNIAQVMAADFVDADRGMIITFDGRVLETRDGGLRWTPVRSDWPVKDSATRLRQRGAEHWYATTLQGRVLETRNAGASWTVVYADPKQRPLNDIAFSGDAALAVGNNGLIVRETP